MLKNLRLILLKEVKKWSNSSREILRTKKVRKVFQKILRTDLQICPLMLVYQISRYLTFQHKKAADTELVVKIKQIISKIRVN